jgi:hypothetical protein
LHGGHVGNHEDLSPAKAISLSASFSCPAYIEDKNSEERTTFESFEDFYLNMDPANATA